MKKIILSVLLGTFSLAGFSQSVTNNFEGGNWLYYSNSCWGIGMNNQYEQFSTNVIGGGFNNTHVCVTDNLGHTNICRLESPWTSLIPGNIKFDHAVPSFNGNRKLTVYLVDQSSNKTNIWSCTYTNSTVQNTTISRNRSSVDHEPESRLRG